MASHQMCIDAGQHVCIVLSGRTCDKEGCGKPAGTLWGEYFCPQHDAERLDNIISQLRPLTSAGEE